MPNCILKLVNVGPIRATSPLPSVPPGSGAPSGWPDKRRDMSGKGMLSALLKDHGVWQSLHPPSCTKYSPRFTALLPVDFNSLLAAPPCARPVRGTNKQPKIVKHGIRIFILPPLTELSFAVYRFRHRQRAETLSERPSTKIWPNHSGVDVNGLLHLRCRMFNFNCRNR